MVSITRKGYIELVYEGEVLSRHTAVEEAYEKALEHFDANQDAAGYTALYRVRYPDREIDLVTLVKTRIRSTSEPVNFALEGSVEAISMSWDPPLTNATYVSAYELQVSTDQVSFSTVSSTITATSYVHSDLAAGTYYYRLRALTEEGYQSPWTSGQATAQAADTAAATMFVASNGSDSTGDGSEESPYATLQKAIDAASAGEVIEMQDASGSGWNYTGVVSTSRSFDSATPVTARVRAGDTVNFYPSTSVTNISEFRSGGQGFSFDGSFGTWRWGDRSHYSLANGGSSAGYPHGTTIRGIESAKHLTFRGIDFSGGNLYAAIQFRGSSKAEYLHFIDCSFARHGTVTLDSRWGDGLQFYNCNQFKVEGCYVGPTYGGHEAIAIQAGGNFAVRDCVFDHKWDELPAGEGYRALGFKGASMQPNWSYPGSTAPAIVERNIIYGPTINPNSTTTTMTLAMRRIIFRFNKFYKCYADDAFVELYAVDKNNSVEHIRVYHNTSHDGGGCASLSGTSALAHTANGGVDVQNNFKDIRFANNIWSDYVPVENMWTTGAYAIVFRDAGKLNLQGYPDHWLGMLFDGNIFDIPEADFRVRLAQSSGYPATGEGNAVGLPDVKSKWPNVFLASNTAENPAFVNSTDFNHADFLKLTSGSAGRGAAVPMATVSSGSSGSVVTLSDAYWIYDGFVWGDVGDYIAFYDSTGVTLKGIRQVASVDSQTQATLTASITVTSGDQVYLVLPDGVSVCRNKGASQV